MCWTRSTASPRNTTSSCTTPETTASISRSRNLAEYASATFWPGGAIQAAVAGGIGLVIAVVAWFLGIPVLSGIAIVIGGFLFVMAVYTFIHEGRKAMKARRAGGEPPTGG